MQSSLLEIAQCLGVAIELLLIESGGLLQHGGRVGCKRTLLFEVSETLAEGQMTGQLDKAKEIAALTAAMAVEEIFAGVDIERRAGFRMQGTESDELGAVTRRGGRSNAAAANNRAAAGAVSVFRDPRPWRSFASGGERRKRRPAFPGKDGGQEKISQSRRGQRICRTGVSQDKGPACVIGRITTRQPVSHAGERLAEKGKSRLGAVQSAGPAAKRGRIGHAIGIFERRRRLFPGAMLHKAPPQCLTASQQAVMGVRERKQRKEGEGLPATGAAAATDPNPVVMFIVRLLAAASVADDRIVFANGASPQNDLGATRGPIGFELVLAGRKVG